MNPTAVRPADTALQEVEAFREAARLAVNRPGLDLRQRCRSIVELASLTQDAAWPWAARKAVWLEVRDFLYTNGAPRPQPLGECTRCGRPCEACGEGAS
jgi:hypothetical protein